MPPVAPAAESPQLASALNLDILAPTEIPRRGETKIRGRTGGPTTEAISVYDVGGPGCDTPSRAAWLVSRLHDSKARVFSSAFAT
ncbi:hypothetical protein DL769_008089 [Monosporascus sp. CRB-8-3]|nr:hypothetical protein DL769_008089 [Monosporascus sp. CRB-8-3]